MFEHFQQYRQILVTGPQRSGTTICAKMIAHDTGMQFLPEGAVATGNKADDMHDALRRLVEKYDDFVVQCPIQCRYIHKFSDTDRLIVMVKRPVLDIEISENRIGWGDAFQKNLYNEIIQEYNLDDIPIAAVKYYYWEHFQKDVIVNWHEQQYEDLRFHELWVPEDLRRVDRTWGPRSIGLRKKFESEVHIESLV